MSTNVTIEKPSPKMRSEGRGRPNARRWGTIAIVSGLVALGAAELAGFDGDDAPSSANVTIAGEPSVDHLPPAPFQEVFPGCLNDIECYGEPSHLPAGYWDNRVSTPAD